MRVYIIPLSDFGFGLESDEALAMRLESVVTTAFSRSDFDGQAEWYYDEFVDPIEHGVKVDIRGLDKAQYAFIIDSIKDVALQHCDAVVVRVS